MPHKRTNAMSNIEAPISELQKILAQQDVVSKEEAARRAANKERRQFILDAVFNFVTTTPKNRTDNKAKTPLEHATRRLPKGQHNLI